MSCVNVNYAVCVSPRKEEERLRGLSLPKTNEIKKGRLPAISKKGRLPTLHKKGGLPTLHNKEGLPTLHKKGRLPAIYDK